MSKRFGRQQKRKMREELLREQKANQVLRDLYQRAINLSNNLTDYLVSHFGQDHILFGMKEIYGQTGDPTMRYMLHKKPSLSSDPAEIMRMTPIETRFITLHRLCIWLEETDQTSWDQTRTDVGFKVDFCGQRACMLVTKELIAKAPLSIVKEMVSDTIADLLKQYKSSCV